MKTITLAIVGSGGTGVVALGDMLLNVAASGGLYGMMRKTFSPQIRGGECAAIIRLGAHPVAGFDDRVDLLLVLDWNNFQRFSEEIMLNPSTLILQDDQAGIAPDMQQQPITLGLSSAAESKDTHYANVAALGYLAEWLKGDAGVVSQVIANRLHLPNEHLALVQQVAQLGAEIHKQNPLPLQALNSSTTTQKTNWVATGNQMAALGALEAGVRFVAAYPITPASDVLEWIAGRIEGLGGHLVQAEDELAAVNMAIGAAYGGVPAFTATSGPGLALMSESMGLAVAGEIPLVILDVQRGGPSTGIPTKSEQSDLNLALYGLHGDAPHIVLSPLSIPDCCDTVAWAVELATELQTLAIVLSDQFLGQSTQVFPPLPPTKRGAHLVQAQPSEEPYQRYLDTESGVSPMVLPGEAGGMYTADGLEHTENAVPSPKAKDHQQQLDKRLRKLHSKDFGEEWASVSDAELGNAHCLLLCWGSIYQTAIEAQQRLQQKNIAADVLGVRLLSPLPTEKLQSKLQNYKTIVVIEQNHQGQFVQYLRSLALEKSQKPFVSIAKPGPSLITPQLITEIVQEVISNEA